MLNDQSSLILALSIMVRAQSRRFCKLFVWELVILPNNIWIPQRLSIRARYALSGLFFSVRFLISYSFILFLNIHCDISGWSRGGWNFRQGTTTRRSS